MAIAPIDLQTLFSQLDKVAKTQSAQRESQVIQQAMQSVQLQRKTEEHIEQVNEAQNMGEGVEKVNDKKQNDKDKGTENRKSREQTEKEDEDNSSVLRDLNLGKKIDISL
jgi:type II secretory pathway pseudopilin PulG